MTMGCRCGIYLHQTPPVKEPAVAVISPSPDRVVHNEWVQTYDELPVPVGRWHSLANWTSVRLGNNPNRPTMNERETEQLTYYSLIDTNEQQNRESDQQNRENEQQNHELDADLMYSGYSSEHFKI